MPLRIPETPQKYDPSFYDEVWRLIERALSRPTSVGGGGGGGGGGSLTVKRGDVNVAGAIGTLDFASPDFDVLESPLSEINVAIASGIARLGTIQTWGALQNFAAVTASSIVIGTDPGGVGALRISGGIDATGPVRFYDNNIVLGQAARATQATINIQTAAGQQRDIHFLSGANQRWNIVVNAVAEGGADAGSNFAIQAFNDAGTLIDAPISITRAAAGGITVAAGRQLALAGALTLAPGGTAKILIDGTDGTVASGEIGIAENVGNLNISTRGALTFVTDNDGTGSSATWQTSSASTTVMQLNSVGGLGLGGASSTLRGLFVQGAITSGGPTQNAIQTDTTFGTDSTTRANSLRLGIRIPATGGPTTFGEAHGILIDGLVTVGANSTVTTYAGLRVLSTTVKPTTQYGVLIDDVTGSTTNIAIKTGLGSVIFGTDPGGAELLRVGGAVRAAQLGLGGTVAADRMLQLAGAAGQTTGASQFGIVVSSGQVFDSTATTLIAGLFIGPTTQNAVFTTPLVTLVNIAGLNKGASHTVTTLIGLEIQAITQGVTNFALRTSTGRVRFGDDVDFTNDNTDDVGQVGAFRPRTGYFGTSVVVGTDPGGTEPLRVGGGGQLTRAADTVNRGLRVDFTGATAGTEYIVAQFNVSGASAQSPAIVLSSNSTIGLRLTHNTAFARALIDHNYASATDLRFGLRGVELLGLTNAGTLVLLTAASRIVPGATSLALRNNADSADNLILLDAGDATLRTKLTMPGPLVLTTAASKIVPGATSLALRNNADNADNLLLTDAGIATFRNDVVMDVLGTFDHTGTRFGTGLGPVADDIMSWHGGAGKWRPRFLQTAFTSGAAVSQNNTDGTFATYFNSGPALSGTPVAPTLAPVVTPMYKSMLIDMSAYVLGGTQVYVLDYSINGAAYSSGRIVSTSAKVIHSSLDPTKTYAYKYLIRGATDSTYSPAAAAQNPGTATEANAFGLIVASQITTAFLSSINANIGSITAGQLVSGDGKSILQLDSTFAVPGTVTQGIFFASANPVGGGVTGMYIDFTATTTNPLLHHSKFDLLADGSAILKGVVRDVNSKFVIDVAGTTARLITIIDEQGTPRTRVKIGEVNTGTSDWGLQVFDNLGATIVDMTAANLLIQDAAVKFKADFTGALLTVTDNQGAPKTRVKLGKIGAGTTDYGLQVFDTSGAAIVDMQASNLLIQDAALKFKVDFTNVLLSIRDNQGASAGLTSSMLSHSGLTAFTAANIVDGDLTNTGWHTDSAVPGAWLKVDLGVGVTRTFRQCGIGNLGAANPTAVWDVEYSDNDSTWTKVATGFKATGTGVTYVTWAAAGAHRYWRILLTNTPGGGPWNTELEFWESIQRVKLGKVGATTTDYGVQVWDQGGATVIDFTGAKRILAVPVQDAGTKSATFTIDLSSGTTQQVQLAANALRMQFTGQVDGGRYRVWFQQDATGTRTIPVFDDIVMWVADTPPTLSTTPGVFDIIEFEYRALPTARFSGVVLAQNVVLPTPTTVAPTTNGIASGTNHNVLMPATVTAGQLLLMFFGYTLAAGAVTTPTGWTLLASGDGDAVPSPGLYIFAKVANGTEGGTNVNVVTTNAVAAIGRVYKISKWKGDVATGIVATLTSGSTTTADPPSLTPGWTDRDLWIAYYVSVQDANNPGPPTNYSDDGTGAIGATAQDKSGRRTLYATTENPGAFGVFSVLKNWRAATVAIRPPA